MCSSGAATRVARSQPLTLAGRKGRGAGRTVASRSPIPCPPCCIPRARHRTSVRVCIVYDCLYPYTVGGAERWYRALVAELIAAGHEVTYLTRRQWPVGTAPD